MNDYLWLNWLIMAASKKLTQYDRDVFVRAVQRDFVYPTEVEEQSRIQDALVKAMSIAARKLYRNSPTALRTERVCLYLTRSRRYVEVIVGDAEVDLDVLAGQTATRERTSTIEAFTAAVKRCSTRKALRETFPELVKYMPDENAAETAFPLAPANLYADLLKAGLKRS